LALQRARRIRERGTLVLSAVSSAAPAASTPPPLAEASAAPVSPPRSAGVATTPAAPAPVAVATTAPIKVPSHAQTPRERDCARHSRYRARATARRARQSHHVQPPPAPTADPAPAPPARSNLATRSCVRVARECERRMLGPGRSTCALWHADASRQISHRQDLPNLWQNRPVRAPGRSFGSGELALQDSVRHFLGPTQGRG
jgi:hypothetical protein